MQIQCNHVSTSEAGDEIYQILFEAERDNVNQLTFYIDGGIVLR